MGSAPIPSSTYRSYAIFHSLSRMQNIIKISSRMSIRAFFKINYIPNKVHLATEPLIDLPHEQRVILKIMFLNLVSNSWNKHRYKN